MLFPDRLSAAARLQHKQFRILRRSWDVRCRIYLSPVEGQKRKAENLRASLIIFGRRWASSDCLAVRAAVRKRKGGAKGCNVTHQITVL
jgi:hypothetical protein